MDSSDFLKWPTRLTRIQVSCNSLFNQFNMVLLHRCCLTVCPSPVEPDQSSNADAELQIGCKARPVQRRRYPPHLQLSDVPLHARGDRGGHRLPLCLPHHRTPLARFISPLPGKVLRRQAVQDIKAWTKADPLPHRGYLPSNNTTSSVHSGEQT